MGRVRRPPRNGDGGGIANAASPLGLPQGFNGLCPSGSHSTDRIHRQNIAHGVALPATPIRRKTVPKFRFCDPFATMHKKSTDSGPACPPVVHSPRQAFLGCGGTLGDIIPSRYLCFDNLKRHRFCAEILSEKGLDPIGNLNSMHAIVCNFWLRVPGRSTARDRVTVRSQPRVNAKHWRRGQQPRAASPLLILQFGNSSADCSRLTSATKRNEPRRHEDHEEKSS